MIYFDSAMKDEEFNIHSNTFPCQLCKSHCFMLSVFVTFTYFPVMIILTCFNLNMSELNNYYVVQFSVNLFLLPSVFFLLVVS